jgi:hypothetical protein
LFYWCIFDLVTEMEDSNGRILGCNDRWMIWLAHHAPWIGSIMPRIVREEGNSKFRSGSSGHTNKNPQLSVWTREHSYGRMKRDIEIRHFYLIRTRASQSGRSNQRDGSRVVSCQHQDSTVLNGTVPAGPEKAKRDKGIGC